MNLSLLKISVITMIAICLWFLLVRSEADRPPVSMDERGFEYYLITEDSAIVRFPTYEDKIRWMDSNWRFYED